MEPSSQDGAGLPESVPPPPARFPWRRLVLAVLLVLGFASFYALGLQRYISWAYLRDHVDLLKTRVEENLPLALLAFFLIYTAAAALSLPSAGVLTLLGGALFGRWLGAGTACLAATLGATLAFLSSRYLFRDFVQHRFAHRLKAINEGVQRDGAFYLFTLRLVPAIPFFLINLGMGLTPLRTWPFIWVSLLGMLPGSFLYAYFGDALAAVKLSPALFISFALLGIVPLVLRKLLAGKVRPGPVNAVPASEQNAALIVYRRDDRPLTFGRPFESDPTVRFR